MTRCGDDRLQDAVDIAQHIIVPKTKNQITICLEVRGSTCIFSTSHRMLAAVELNDQLGGLTTEIDHVGPNRHLSPKFHSVKSPVAQAEPQPPLSVCLIAP
jgi:hypothetical protein